MIIGPDIPVGYSLICVSIRKKRGFVKTRGQVGWGGAAGGTTGARRAAADRQ